MFEKYHNVVFKMLKNAVKSSFSDLFAKYPEHYYYCTVVLSEGAPPFISAWSNEAFDCFCKEKGIVTGLKYMYSYADSPYCGYGYDEYFCKIKSFFINIVDKIDNDNDYSEMIDLWALCLEEVMIELDNNDFFTLYFHRNDILLNVEVIPSEKDVLEVAKKMNPSLPYERYREYVLKTERKVKEIDYRTIYHPEKCDVYVAKPIKDKKCILKVKEVFCYTGTMRELLDKCSKPGELINSDVDYKTVVELIKQHPIYSEFFKIVLMNK